MVVFSFRNVSAEDGALIIVSHLFSGYKTLFAFFEKLFAKHLTEIGKG